MNRAGRRSPKGEYTPRDHYIEVTGASLQTLGGLKKLHTLVLSDVLVTDQVLHGLREAGLLHALIQADLARRAGVAAASLSDVLAGKRELSPRVRAILADYFGVSAAYLT